MGLESGCPGRAVTAAFAVTGVILFQPHLGQLLCGPIRRCFRPQAHFILFGIQIGVTEDRVVDVDDSNLLAPEYPQPGLDNLVKEVHIL